VHLDASYSTRALRGIFGLPLIAPQLVRCILMHPTRLDYSTNWCIKMHPTRLLGYALSYGWPLWMAVRDCDRRLAVGIVGRPGLNRE
jgi:hypothetical protein